ncbi:MAG TPA: Shedu immune nuclease family protein [Terracidiphilus sp.]|nr:Shedu immune nuclease family protein [Terracidiphilus sp.]
MANVRTQKVTDSFIAIDKPIRLDETSRTRRIFVPSFSVDAAGKKHLRGKFLRQKKGRSGWEDEEGISLKCVAPGEAVRFELPSEAMGRFLEGIGALLMVAQMPSIEERSQRFSIALSNKVIEISDEALRPAIQELIAKGHSREFLDQLALLKPQEAEMFADEQVLRRRRLSLDEFEGGLADEDWDEPRWGKFFEMNRWIFGLGLRYQFLHQLQGQAHYGGSDVRGKGEQKGDYLHYTEGKAKFIVLVEIKRPDSPIFQAESGGRQYRNGVPGFHPEFANAISQVQVNTRTWEVEGSQSEANRDRLQPGNISTVHPRSLLIYGNTSQLDSREKRVAFELFRGQLKHTEIVTYDELHYRAQFIVGELSGDIG